MFINNIHLIFNFFHHRGNDDRLITHVDSPVSIRAPSARASSERERSKEKSHRQSSNESNPKRSRRSGHHSSHHRKRRSSDTTQASSNSDRSHLEPSNSSTSVNVEPNIPNVENPNVEVQNEQGRIGVAALPNVQIQGEQQQSRRNDFII